MEETNCSSSNLEETCTWNVHEEDVKMENTENKGKAENYQDQNLVFFLFNCKFIHYVSGRMAANIKEEKVSIKEEMSTIKETCDVYVQEEMSTVKETCDVYVQEEKSTVEETCTIYVQEERSTVEETCTIYVQEERSTVEETCTIYVQEEDVKMEITKTQGCAFAFKGSVWLDLVVESRMQNCRENFIKSYET